LRGIPAEVKEEFATSVKQFRDDLENAEAVDPALIHEWFETKGFTKDEANPLDLWIYSAPVDEAVAGEGDSLADMSAAGLKKLAKDLGVEDYAKLAKEDLIAAIQAKQAVLNPAPVVEDKTEGDGA
jgi:hypothetical protein